MKRPPKFLYALLDRDGELAGTYESKDEAEADAVGPRFRRFSVRAYGLLPRRGRLEEQPCPADERRRGGRMTLRPTGGPFVSETGATRCRVLDDADFAELVRLHAKRTPRGTMFPRGWLSPNTKCVDPATLPLRQGDTA